MDSSSCPHLIFSAAPSETLHAWLRENHTSFPSATSATSIQSFCPHQTSKWESFSRCCTNIFFSLYTISSFSWLKYGTYKTASPIYITCLVLSLVLQSFLSNILLDIFTWMSPKRPVSLSDIEFSFLSQNIFLTYSSFQWIGKLITRKSFLPSLLHLPNHFISNSC